ncbi:Wzz/FepE/Etk N-terminal domain-containing protein [Massilia sp. Bi118]|uniref:GumC family protein n=1 Tax=Massilia sp. Bi118 TaxID=2822346 RepID=UPI001E560C1F|nr:Wzz/FepE/Etk N-terminal domain-containing protein [Massilia sp. Bi118]
MSNFPVAEGETSDRLEEQGTTLFDVLVALSRHKRMIIVIPLIVAIIAAAVSFMIPKSYKASTNLLPPQQAQSSASMLLSQLGSIAGMAGGMAGIKNPNDLYIGMLKSRTIADKLIEKYDLKKVYSTESQELARKKLAENTNISSGKDGLIVIEAEDENPKLVAKLANGYVDELFQLTKNLTVTEASQRRAFFERQLEHAKDNLANAEMSLKGSLDTGGVISVDTQSRAVLETAARLRAQISAKEIQLNSMRPFVTSSHPEYKRTEQELSSLRDELAKLERGTGGDTHELAADSRTSTGGLGSIKLLRDVKYYQMLYELLAKQYEVARLDEAKEPSMIQILDRAVDPERPFKPKRLIIVFITTMFAFLLTVVAALLLEAKRKLLASPAGAARWTEIKSNLRSK